MCIRDRTVGYSWEEVPHDNRHKRLIKQLNQIMPMDRYLNLMISAFAGGSKDKCIIEIGGASNGKSTLNDTVAPCLFGQYYQKVGGSLFCSHKNPDKDIVLGTGKPCPEALKLEGKRYIVSGEPASSNGKVRLNQENLKQILGGDIIAERNGFDFTLDRLGFTHTGQIHIHLNSDPVFNPNKAMRRRLLLINYPSEFITEGEYESIKRSNDWTDADMEERCKYKTDSTLTNFLREKSTGQALFQLCVEKHRRNIAEGYNICDGYIISAEEMALTEETFDELDCFDRFISDTYDIVAEDRAENRYPLIQLRKDYDKYLSQHDRKDPLSLSELKQKLSRVKGIRYNDKKAKDCTGSISRCIIGLRKKAETDKDDL